MEQEVYTALTFVELTTVHYQHDDPFGLFNAYVTLIPIAIAIGVITLILFRRDVRTISIFLGLLFSECTNYVLKKSIKEHRPTMWKELRKQSYGMPSSHSQFMFFFAVLMTLFYLKKRIRFGSKILPIISVTFLFFLAAGVAYSRVHLYYHTAKQVFCGSFIGICLGFIWYGVIEYIFRPYLFPIIINHPIGKYFYLRDSSEIEDLLNFEYTNVMNKVKTINKTKPIKTK
ncbi:hypothetical protein ACTFIW_003942 [Dictyostelium discoideum]|uniref:Dolichyldiphosphatase 1 n=1 Tax=Dictyostelium discoideum TaxID=44689 RepID=DOPP1_DICDI|nr:dolichyldiphosphatase 1 [Dictyostelium discoideum AX4]Q86IX2.1 RecName: Full=Dolichyldiphosphatase 1; AltName: Full=Dolichyl pyrophosphate phosphatase 1 [Dictyostelium discoideum]EAL70188.1 dolichyldiphosphatase 1 [Dictyostelium discoideum AX4]|eukprot:XP_643909.1 dolichyldiphosphatase 1 [Dictyostelium discoideum AX4]